VTYQGRLVRPDTGPSTRYRELLHLWGGLVDLPGRLQGREARLWLMDRSGTRLVLRRLNPLLFPAQDGVAENRLWVHRLLVEIVHAGFPAPAPIPTRDGARPS
jgi:hypothetical protein